MILQTFNLHVREWFESKLDKVSILGSYNKKYYVIKYYSVINI